MATPAQLAEKARMSRPSPLSPTRVPPELPPRANTVFSPPPYSPQDASKDAEVDDMVSNAWKTRDPRRLSTDSLYPKTSRRDRRRTLLLIYIHGFMGNESSFQSFPAHVHNLLSTILRETHLVHTKIYPRYKSRKTIEFAREEFSSWLEPNIKYGTDIVLVGHSMGGILAAEVALKPSTTPATGQPFHHRILGTLNFDTPFLGIHPGVISSGISSLFRSAPEPPANKFNQSSINLSGAGYRSDQALSIAGGDEISSPNLTPSITSPLSSPSPKDPTFDPPYPNDIRQKERTPWSSFMHFVNKHSDNLTAASKQYIISHLEFGGCLADYPALKSRCDKLRALEDVDELAGLDRPGYRRPVRRIRFANYYTASTGRPKIPKTQQEQKPSDEDTEESSGVEMQNVGADRYTSTTSPIGSPIYGGQMESAVTSSEHLSSRRNLSHIQTQSQFFRESARPYDEREQVAEMRHIDADPVDDDWSPTLQDVTDEGAVSPSYLTPEFDLSSVEAALPPIPDLPIEPEPIDLSVFTDKDARKIAEKEHKSLVKIYQQAVKHRESAIKDRKKLAEKREKKARQDREKQLKSEETSRLKEEKDGEKRKPSLVPPTSSGDQSPVIPPQAKPEAKPKKEKKFCLLPPKRGGNRDKCWIRVHMEGVDEVGAHCGLFFPTEHYENLVRDVGERIKGWVHEDAIRRIALEGEGGD